VTIEGRMPNGGTNQVRMTVANIPALLAMKGHAIDGRLKTKDAYDIYFSIAIIRAASMLSCRPASP
jgi:hypothetical protein